MLLLLFAFRELWKEWGDSNYWMSLEHFNVLLYIILSITVSFLEDTVLFFTGLLFFHFVYIYIFWQVHFACVLCGLCASCGSSQCCVLHDLQFVDSGRGCKRRPYGRGILQSRSHDCLIGSHDCLLLFTPSCCCEWFYHL